MVVSAIKTGVFYVVDLSRANGLGGVIRAVHRSMKPGDADSSISVFYCQVEIYDARTSYDRLYE